VTEGGNRALKPETGHSRSFGLVYASDIFPGLQFSATQWNLVESNSIQALGLQTIVDNSQLFPGAVTRAPSVNGQPGRITAVQATFTNFGRIDVSGLDYSASYTLHTSSGEWMPTLSATQTYRYSTVLTPGAVAEDRTSKANDDGNFAPRWKGTAGLGWKYGPFGASMDGRYIGKYQDYHYQTFAPQTRYIGNFWLFDASFRYDLGQALGRSFPSAKNTYVTFGGVNLLNATPQYSNFSFGGVGYDPAEADVRGRVLYLQAGTKF
jgi:iron complex outermembrane receptor protein